MALPPLPPLVQDAGSAVFGGFNRLAFKSAPAGAPVERSSTAWSFAAMGDFGAGTRAQLDVAKNVLKGQQELVVTLGDTVYEKGRESEYRTRFDPPERFGDIRAKYPVYPSVGNHDVAGGGVKPYFKRFPEAEGRRYYSFDHKDVRFFSLDSTQPLRPDTPQWKWFEGALSQAWDGWKIVYMHHPLRSGMQGRDRPEDAERVNALLAKHGVSLLLAGHDHAYDRSKPMNEFGTVQVTSGNGGRMLYPYLSKQPEWSAHRAVQHGHVDVEVRNDALVVRHINRDGKTEDTALIQRHA